jgi:hypothetical protein
MTQAFVTQTAFTAGELDPRMLGRTDLRAYESGASKLRNVFVDTTGGVRRRPGSTYVATAAGRGRLVGLEIGPDETYLLVFSDLQVQVFRGTALRATVPTPWNEAQVSQIGWAQLRHGLIITHPDVPAQRLLRTSETVWSLEDLAFAEKAGGVTCAPFARFAHPAIQIQASATTGSVTLTASEPAFIADHIGGRVRIKSKQVAITNLVSSTQAAGLVIEDLEDADPTTDWDELAFSDARGWPVAVSFHQDRMVIGGSRDLPDGLWLSRIGSPFDFDLGEGLDDESISFRLASSEVQAIRAVVSGRHLQVFTSAGEWIVTGEPLTPTNIQVLQQSRVGSPRDRHVPPRDVDGATLFAARNGREIREYLFTVTEQAYQTADLALLARHLVDHPIDQVFDQASRLFLVVMANGALASIAIYRNAEIAAWSLQETKGRFVSVAVVDGTTMLLVERANGVFLERFDESLFVDSGLHLSAAEPALVWSGLDHLEGQTVAVVADGLVSGKMIVSGGQITLAQAARELVVGLPYAHVIEPLPSALLSGQAGQNPAYRPVRVTLRLFESQSVHIDTGDGLRDIPLHSIGGGPLDRSPSPFTGDKSLRALGWRRGTEQPAWRIEQDTPLPCTLLSATTEVKVNS